MSFAINLGAILLFDPPTAALIAAGGVVAANLLQAMALDIILFNGAQVWITVFLSASFWHHVRTSPDLLAWTPLDFASLLVCALIYFVVNGLLVTIGISFAHRLPMRQLINKNTLWVLPNHLALGSLGFLVALLYVHVGVYGVLLLWVPLLLARYSFQQYIAIQTAHLETIQALASALDAKDPHTRGHSDRVSRYAVAIARAMKLPESEVEMIRYAGILHDIGKIGISDAVLNKVGPLSEEEFELVKSHSKIGAQMVRPVGFLRGVSSVIRHHHERYDGKGYPDGIGGEEVPVGARILAVADAFDAMTNDRVYRSGMDVDRAVEQLIEGRGTQFDPDVVDVFINRVLPEQRDLVMEAAAKRRPDGAGEGDRLWRTLLDEDRGKEARDDEVATQKRSAKGMSKGIKEERAGG